MFFERANSTIAERKCIEDGKEKYISLLFRYVRSGLAGKSVST